MGISTGLNLQSGDPDDTCGHQELAGSIPTRLAKCWHESIPWTPTADQIALNGTVHAMDSVVSDTVLPSTTEWQLSCFGLLALFLQPGGCRKVHEVTDLEAKDRRVASGLCHRQKVSFLSIASSEVQTKQRVWMEEREQPLASTNMKTDGRKSLRTPKKWWCEL